MFKPAHRHVFVFLAVLLLASAAKAVPAFSNLFAFGDSLTDTGNLVAFAPSTCPPSPPYAGCKFSNGPLWIEGLAASLGLSVSPAFAGGSNNYAVAGAVANDLLVSQIPAFSAAVSGSADPGALYVVWAGANDGLFSLNPFIAADKVKQAILDLSALGATSFLVPNLPDLSLTPLGTGNASALTFTLLFNNRLAANLASLGGSGLEISFFDIFTRTNEVVANPGAFGFTNITGQCVNAPAGTNCDQYLFWDDVHPTRAAHALIASNAVAVLPEPSTAVFLLLGLAGLAARRRRGF